MLWGPLQIVTKRSVQTFLPQIIYTFNQLSVRHVKMQVFKKQSHKIRDVIHNLRSWSKTENQQKYIHTRFPYLNTDISHLFTSWLIKPKWSNSNNVHYFTIAMLPGCVSQLKSWFPWVQKVEKLGSAWPNEWMWAAALTTLVCIS